MPTADINAVDENGYTELMRAAERNDIEKLESLIAAGADLNISSKDGSTAYRIALGRDHYAAGIILEQAGADKSRFEQKYINSIDHERDVYLYLLKRLNGLTRFKFCSYGLSLTELAVACCLENDPLVQALLALGEDVNKLGREGETALMWSAMLKKPQVARTLLVCGADPGIALEGGSTAILQACREYSKKTRKADRRDESLEIIEVLLRAGVDVNYRDRRGADALRGVVWNGDIDYAQFLISAGAKIDPEDDLNFNLLLGAAESGDLKAVNRLIEAGVDINKKDVHKRTALSEAVQGGRLPVVQALIERGANVTDDFSKLFLSAISRSNSDIFKALLHARCSKGPFDEKNKPILFRAIESGNLEAVQALIAVGFLKLESYASPLQFAIGRSWPEIVQALINAGEEVKERELREADHPVRWRVPERKPSMHELNPIWGGFIPRLLWVDQEFREELIDALFKYGIKSLKKEEWFDVQKQIDVVKEKKEKAYKEYYDAFEKKYKEDVEEMRCLWIYS